MNNVVRIPTCLSDLRDGVLLFSIFLCFCVSISLCAGCNEEDGQEEEDRVAPNLKPMAKQKGRQEVSLKCALLVVGHPPSEIGLAIRFTMTIVIVYHALKMLCVFDACQAH